MSEKFPGGLEIHGRVGPGYRGILCDDALSLLAKLHRAFEPRRAALLALRAARQKELDQGKLPDFLPATRSIRESDWTIAPQPSDLLDRRKVTVALFRQLLAEELAKVRAHLGEDAWRGGRYEEAAQLFDRITTGDYIEFLTLPAYEMID